MACADGTSRDVTPCIGDQMLPMPLHMNAALSYTLSNVKKVACNKLGQVGPELVGQAQDVCPLFTHQETCQSGAAWGCCVTEVQSEW